MVASPTNQYGGKAERQFDLVPDLKGPLPNLRASRGSRILHDRWILRHFWHRVISASGRNAYIWIPLFIPLGIWLCLDLARVRFRQSKIRITSGLFVKHRELKDCALLIGLNSEGDCVYSAKKSRWSGIGMVSTCGTAIVGRRSYQD